MDERELREKIMIVNAFKKILKINVPVTQNDGKEFHKRKCERRNRTLFSRYFDVMF